MIRYSDYRDSGLPWLASVPAHWSVLRLMQVASSRTSNVDKHTVDGEISVRLCNYTDVYKNASITADMEFMSATATPEQVARFRLAHGDTVITKDSETADDIGVPAFVSYAAPDLVCGYHLAVVRPRPTQADPRFLYWTMAARPTLRQWAVLATGVTRVGLKTNDLARASVVVPPLSEQRAIAVYLDHETTQIDALIGKQEQLIETLRERRAAAVDSAVDGHEPWRLRRLVDPGRPMTYGILQAGEPQAVGVPYIGPSDMAGEGRSPRRDDLRRTTRVIAAQYKRSTLQGGDVVVSIGPAYGKVAVLLDELDGANLTQDTVRVACRPDRVLPDYLVWVLGSRTALQFWDTEIAGATFRRLNLGTLGATPIPLPTIVEQRRIAAHLEEQTAKIDVLIGRAERFIDLAKERRSALITAAVTGQIDVRTTSTSVGEGV